MTRQTVDHRSRVGGPQQKRLLLAAAAVIRVSVG
jgi:hypothetical protein